MDYFHQNCGDSSYEEQLQKEAYLISKIANSDLVKEWGSCMARDKQGLFVTAIAPENSDSSWDNKQFSVQIFWFSKENSVIDNINLSWVGSNIRTEFDTIEKNGFNVSKNIKPMKSYTYDSICFKFGLKI